jgi:hypothetical protein
MKEWRTTHRTDVAGADTSPGSASQCSPDARRRSRAPARAVFFPRTIISPQVAGFIGAPRSSFSERQRRPALLRP